MIQREIFCGKRSIVFSDESPSAVSGPHVLAIDAVDGSAVAKVWEIFLLNEQIKHLYLCGAHSESSFEAFVQALPLEKAAGGLVVSPGGRLLMIHRRGEWDLPKGKQEPGESDEATALREVQEETGVAPLRITSPLCSTYHVYARDGSNCIKRTVWYAMATDAECPLVPQEEEEIDRAEWLTTAEAWERAQSTFPSIQRVLEAYGEGRKA